MNHGHALMRRADPASLEQAIDAYARAIAIQRATRPPPTARADLLVWINSHGAALMNRGQLLHQRHGLARADEALASLTDAIAVLSSLPPDAHPWLRRNLAGSRLNRANLALDCLVARRVCGGAEWTPASDDARAALDLVRARERDDPIDADLALKARRALCDALGQQIARADAAGQDALATEAGDIVDDALALARAWAARGEAAFAPLALRFFRFGAELYRRNQPHFLVEFIEENLGAPPAPWRELAAIARTALTAALADGETPARHTFGDPASERALDTRRELAAALARLDRSALVA